MARHIARGDTEDTATERQVREAIQRHLVEVDMGVSGLRLHDNSYGDFEIDPKDLLHSAVSWAMDLTGIVGERSILEKLLGERHLLRMERRQA